MIAPPTLEDLTHLALSGLVDSSNEVWRVGTDLVSVARELGLDWGHILYVSSGRLQMYVGLYVEHAMFSVEVRLWKDEVSTIVRRRTLYGR